MTSSEQCHSVVGSSDRKITTVDVKEPIAGQSSCSFAAVDTDSLLVCK